MSASQKAFGNLLKNSSMMFLLNLAAAGVSVVTIPVMLAIAGVASYGHLVLVQSIALTVFTVCGFQYWQGMLITLPGYRVDFEHLRGALLISVKFDMLAVGLVVLAGAVLALSGIEQVREFSAVNLLLLSLAAVFPVIGTHSAYFRLVNRYNALMFVGFLASLLKLLSLGLVSHYAPTMSNMVLAYTLPEILRFFLLFALIFTWRTGIAGELDAAGIKPGRILEAGKWSTLQAICDLPVAQLDRVIIGFALPGHNLGVFSILKRIYALVNLATAPFYSASIPEFASRSNSGDIRGAFVLWLKTMKMLFGVTVCAGLVCYLSKPVWMPLVFPILLDYTSEFTVVLLTAVVAGTFVTTHSFYWALGKMRQTTVISVASNVLYLAVLGLLTMYFDLLGAVVAFLIHVLLVASLKIYLLRRIALKNK